jgi:hypothetical protein
MRGSTQGQAGVGSTAVVDAMVRVQLEMREQAGLPKAANGHTIAPSDPGVAQILKDMGQGGSKEYARLYRVALCNLKDGVPLDQVEKPILLLLAAIRAEASTRTDRPISPLMRDETRCQAKLDLAQLKLAESPESIEAHEAVLAEHAQYARPFNELGETVRQRLVVLRSAPRETFGTRRGNMQLHRA